MTAQLCSLVLGIVYKRKVPSNKQTENHMWKLFGGKLFFLVSVSCAGVRAVLIQKHMGTSWEPQALTDEDSYCQGDFSIRIDCSVWPMIIFLWTCRFWLAISFYRQPFIGAEVCINSSACPRQLRSFHFTSGCCSQPSLLREASGQICLDCHEDRSSLKNEEF